MSRSPGVQRSQVKDMYWFAHGGIEPPVATQRPMRSTTPAPDTEDESSESGSLSLKANQERRAASEEPVICESSDTSLSTRSHEKRQAVEERRRLIAEAEQEKNDAIVKKRIEREAAYEAKRNAQRSNIAFAFGSAISRNSETDGHPQRSSEIERPRMLPTPLANLSSKAADNIMSQSMFASMYSTRGRRKNDLTPTIPYDRMGPPRTAPPTRKRSVSMSRLDQLAQPRKAYVEAQKANSTISNSSKEARHSPTRPLSVASEKSLAANKHVSTSVTRRPTTAARKPRPISIAGSVPDRTSRTEKKSTSRAHAPSVKADKVDTPQSTGKSFTSHLRTSRAKSSSTERAKKPPAKTSPEKPPSASKSPSAPKTNKASPKSSSKQQTSKSSVKQFSPKTSPSRKELTNKKQASMLVSSTLDKANAGGDSSSVKQSSSPARSSTPEIDSSSADEKGNAKRIVSEEEAKAALAEKRRLAREQAEKEAELERQRQEELKREEEERLRLEEEEQRRIEEEQLRLLEEHSEFEKEKLRKAIEEQQRKEEEEKLKREEEARLKAEQERKTKEEAEKQRIELEEKLKREEEERAERKKRLEKIMSRTRGSKSGTASPGSGSGSDVPDSTESQPEIISSEPNSLDSNMAVESLPIDNFRSDEASASESFEFNQTVNLDSQSLSSNDLMIPSSGHTSIDSNVPLAGHPPADVHQTTTEEIKSEADEMSQSECTIKNVASEDSLLRSSIIHSDFSAVEQENKYLEEVRDEANAFVSHVIMKGTENAKLESSPISSHEVQSGDISEHFQGTDFDEQESCELEVESETCLKSDDSLVTLEIQKQNTAPECIDIKEKSDSDDVGGAVNTDVYAEEHDLEKHFMHASDEIAVHDTDTHTSEIKESGDMYGSDMEVNHEESFAIKVSQSVFGAVDDSGKDCNVALESRDGNLCDSEVVATVITEETLDHDELLTKTDVNKCNEVDEKKGEFEENQENELENSSASVQISSTEDIEQINDQVANTSAEDVKEQFRDDPMLFGKTESDLHIVEHTKNYFADDIIKTQMKSAENSDDEEILKRMNIVELIEGPAEVKSESEESSTKDDTVSFTKVEFDNVQIVKGDTKPVEKEFIESELTEDELVGNDVKPLKEELVEYDIKPVKEELIEYDVKSVKEEPIEYDVKSVKEEPIEYDIKSVKEEFVEYDVKPVKEELVEYDVKPVKQELVEYDVKPVKQELGEYDAKSVSDEFVESKLVEDELIEKIKDTAELVKQLPVRDITEPAKEHFMDDLNSSKTNLELADNQFVENSMKFDELDFVSQFTKDIEETIKQEPKDEFTKFDRGQNIEPSYPVIKEEEFYDGENNQFSQNLADRVKNPFSGVAIEPIDQFVESSMKESSRDEFDHIVEAQNDNFFEHVTHPIESQLDNHSLPATKSEFASTSSTTYENEQYGHVVEPLYNYMKGSTEFEINKEIENNTLHFDNTQVESLSPCLVDTQKCSANLESSDVTAIDMQPTETVSVLEKNLACDIAGASFGEDFATSVIEMPDEYEASQIVAPSEFESQVVADDTIVYAQESTKETLNDYNFSAGNPFQRDEYLQQGIYEPPLESFPQNTSDFSNFRDETPHHVLPSYVPQSDIQFSTASNLQYNQISKDCDTVLTSKPVELSEISCDILPDSSDAGNRSSVTGIKDPEAEQFSYLTSKNLKTEEQILLSSHSVDTSVLLPSKDSFTSDLQHVVDLPPPNVYSNSNIQDVSHDTELVLENPPGFSDNVMFESTFNPFTSPSQQLDCGATAGFKVESERFADHGVLKTVDEMNITNLEETNKRLGASYVYEQVEGAYKDYEPLPFEFHSQDQSTIPDAAYSAGHQPSVSYSDTKFKDYEGDDVLMSTDTYGGFETSATTGMPRTMNPFDNFASAEVGISSEQVLSHYSESNVNKELLMGVLNSAIEESEDSSLDSNLSQVLHVEAIDNAVSLATQEVSRLDVLDNKVLTNVSPMQHEEIFVPKTNGYNSTYNNGCLHGDRFESAEFKADQIPVSSKELEHDHPTSEKGNNIPTVDNGNKLDNEDNVNSNKVTSNPFLISSNPQQFSLNPLEIQDDKTLST